MGLMIVSDIKPSSVALYENRTICSRVTIPVLDQNEHLLF